MHSLLSPRAIARSRVGGALDVPALRVPTTLSNINRLRGYGQDALSAVRKEGIKNAKTVESLTFVLGRPILWPDQSVLKILSNPGGLNESQSRVVDRRVSRVPVTRR